jgi:hypothetical protein
VGLIRDLSGGVQETITTWVRIPFPRSRFEVGAKNTQRRTANHTVITLSARVLNQEILGTF